MLELATEHMARAIEEITVNQGIDPRTAVLVGGGGAAGLNAVAIARRLGCPLLIIPEVAAVLSAAGALMSDLTSDFGATHHTLTKDFDLDGVNATLAGLIERCNQFIAGPGEGSLESQIELAAEARYPHQNWEIEVPLGVEQFAADDVEQLRQDFHTRHEEIFAINDPDSAVEVVGWRARVRCRLRESESRQVLAQRATHQPPATRRAYFRDAGEVEAAVRLFESLEPGETLSGPALIESPTTTVVIEPGATVERSGSGSLTIEPGVAVGAGEAAAVHSSEG
jgi:N-methylhydantoinase A